MDEAANVLIATRSCFRYTALDHLHIVSLVQSKKRHEILDPVIFFPLFLLQLYFIHYILCMQLLSYMHAHSTYFHQGSDLFQDVDPFLKSTAVDVIKSSF